jgi:Holliday junction resolvase-like predicted endonuclease
MSRVYVAGDRLNKALEFAESRDEHFDNKNPASHLTGALGEFGTCTWLEEDGVKIGSEAHPAFLCKDEQGEADVLVADKALRIEIKSNAKGNPRYRVKAADEKKIKRKADVVLWCEVDAIEPDIDLIDHEPVLIGAAADVTILGWVTVDEAFLAPLDGEYRFMSPKQVHPPSDLLTRVHAALADHASLNATPPEPDKG